MMQCVKATTVGLKMEEGAGARERGWPLEAQKERQGNGSSLEPPEGDKALLTP